ncbi:MULTISPECIES: AMP-binding protein [unclassified Streptomyces]|uniref:(2,3-dihydroxybenzoyl)adenylate synthase n=1 Tax=unclassified Streptomyces TaxID=2593676 RepID=UPI000363D588|nr:MULTISPECIES: AMP-binding protein [unclassified Streptomyces]MYT29242.1 AMP-binding protein [Streptomyces sp. SID8354]
MGTDFHPWPDEFAGRYRRAGHWRGEVLGDLVRDHARVHGERTALVADGGRMTYARLDRLADRRAAGMAARLGLRRGDRVVVQLPNCTEFVVSTLALFRLGAVPVFALPAHRMRELSHLCEMTGAAAYLSCDQWQGEDHRELATRLRAELPRLRHAALTGDPGPHTGLDALTAEPALHPRPSSADVAFCLLSGGTTGVPKLIPRTHDDYAYQLRTTATEMGFTQDSVYLAALPAAHNAALGCPGVLGALYAGGTAVLAGSPAPDEVFDLVAAEGVTLTTVMPAVLELWLEAARLLEPDLSRLTVEIGGAPLDPALAVRAHRELGLGITHWFGMAEGLLCFTRPGEAVEAAARTQGLPLSADDELQIVDERERPVPEGESGELLVRGPYTLRGYYGDPARGDGSHSFTHDGFLRTGDLVRRDPEGRLVVTGRIKEVVNRGGEKVPVHELEQLLRAHPAVDNVAVVGLPDSALGERTCAFLVMTGEATGEELTEYLTDLGLARYKLPDRYEFREALPYTPVGKVDRKVLVSQVAP